jgi:PKD repeat protein
MMEKTTSDPAEGLDCIRASFGGSGATWGGWYFMNGVLEGTETVPKENWGTVPDAGVNLTGAHALKFYARGEQGGERVEFFTFGVGRNDVTGDPISPYPDSSKKKSTGYITLTNQWREYTIDVSSQDLTYVLGGFGWVSSSGENEGQPIVFYLDDIQYDLSRLNEPGFLQSYQTMNSGKDFDLVMSNVGYSYDNAVALIAFLAQGGEDGKRRAGLIADAFVYAQKHDRYFTDGRIRNAYQAGDLVLPPGWEPRGKIATVRMPGWWDDGRDQWSEDAVQVGTHTGNIAWTGLALLAYYNTTKETKYLHSVEKLGDWVLLNCADGSRSGFTGGYEGWEPSQTRLMYKATEHNIDLYAMFMQLYAITGETRWYDAAENARGFVLSMWDPVEGKFWTGTGADGLTINQDFVPTDIQAWSIQSLGDVIPQSDHVRALHYVDENSRVGLGYDFNTDRDGVWPEGTGQMAVSFHLLGDSVRSNEIVQYLHTVQNADGSIDAASKDELSTGVKLSNGNWWVYYKRPHVGATGWLSLAESGKNPFNISENGVIPVPGQAVKPADTDHDGLYEDLNGNGGLDFNDVVLYFNQMDWIAGNEPASAFDFNHNGQIDFNDVVQLFKLL